MTRDFWTGKLTMTHNQGQTGSAHNLQLAAMNGLRLHKNWSHTHNNLQDL